MTKWFRDNLAGPLSMFFIASLGAGVFTLVSIALANQTQLKLMAQFMKNSVKNDDHHDSIDKEFKKAIKSLAEGHTEIKFLRRDVDKLTIEFDDAHE